MYPIAIHWIAFPLHPETPEDGQPLEALFAGQPVDIPAMLSKLEQVARKLGLPFGPRTMTFNSRRAQELGKWAEDQGRGDAFHDAVFRAYFQRGENIAWPAVLEKLCTVVGLDPALAREAMEARPHREAVDRDWRRCRQMGITAVPTFVMGGQRLVGAQPYHRLEKMVNAAMGRDRP